MTGQPTDPPVADPMVTEVAKAYYPHALAAADAARDRAQAGYTIAAAIATALVAAGVFTDFRDFPGWVQALGVLALLLWMTAAYLFMRAVSERELAPGESPTELETQPSDLAFVKSVLGTVKRERAAVERDLRGATLAVLLAMVATLGTVIGILGDEDPDPKKAGTVFLTPAGSATASTICKTEGVTALAGHFDPSKLKDEFVSITIDAGACRDEKADVRLRKKEIAGASVAGGG